MTDAEQEQQEQVGGGERGETTNGAPHVKGPRKDATSENEAPNERAEKHRKGGRDDSLHPKGQALSPAAVSVVQIAPSSVSKSLASTSRRVIDAVGSYPTTLPPKEGAVETAIPRKIEKIKFGIMDSVEIIKSAEFQVHERSLYKMPDRVPSHGGVLDPRLGVSNKNQKCETCHQKLKECTGHFGYIKLELPVFHIGYFRSTLQILQCICKTCARVLLTDKDRRMTAKQFRKPSLERVRRELLFKGVLDKCKRAKSCPHCGQRNGPVKKAPSSLKLIHDQFNKDEGLMQEYHREFELARRANQQLTDQNMKSTMDDLNPLRVQVGIAS